MGRLDRIVYLQNRYHISIEYRTSWWVSVKVIGHCLFGCLFFFFCVMLAFVDNCCIILHCNILLCLYFSLQYNVDQCFRIAVCIVSMMMMMMIVVVVVWRDFHSIGRPFQTTNQVNPNRPNWRLTRLDF